MPPAEMGVLFRHDFPPSSDVEAMIALPPSRAVAPTTPLLADVSVLPPDSSRAFSGVDIAVSNGQELVYLADVRPALAGLTREMAADFGKLGVRVNAVAPGLMYLSGPQTQDNFNRAASANLLRQPINPADVASSVVFLASNASITGTTVRVDNGQHLVPLARDVMFVVEELFKS